MSVPLIEVAAAPGVRACFSTRAGGVSTGPWEGLNLGIATGDDPEHVRANRRRLCEAVGVDRERVTLVHQVHGSAVHRVGAPTRPGRFTGGLRGWPQADALVTGTHGVAVAVLAADCLPLLLWRTDGSAVAAAHAGWRGIVDGVIEAAVTALGDPARTAAAIGPGVRPCCYPVSAELRARFARDWGAASVVGDAVDLAAAAAAALVRAGVAPERVQAVPACTSCSRDRFFSFRRDGAASGRQAGIIVRIGP